MKFVANELGLGAPENLSSGDLRRLRYTADQLLNEWEDGDLEGGPAALDVRFNKLVRQLNEIQKKVEANGQ